MKHIGLYFECDITDLPAGLFDVIKFELDEGLSRLFTLSLSLFSAKADIDLSDLLLRRVTLSVYAHGVLQRKVQGIIAEATKGKSGFHRTAYTLTVRPHLWLTTQRQMSRIFHNKTIPQIVDEIMDDHNIRVNSKLYHEHLSREYVTQKREKDYDFLSRIMAEEGITFWFEPNEGDQPEICFYSDSNMGQMGGLFLTYNDHPQSAVTGNIINDFIVSAKMVPQTSTGKDRSDGNPLYPYLHTSANKTNAGNINFYNIYESYGRFPADAAGENFADYRLQQYQAESETFLAKSNCMQVMPGKKFTLKAHPDPKLNARWQVVSVIHHGKQPQALEEDSDGGATLVSNQMQLMSALKEYRPPYHYKPLADGPEPATVVGPANEEIFTNKQGQVKIHFHWNLLDKPNENASCWVRVLQGWSGSSYGFYAVPRIGQEVIIDYIHGDIDRPIVVGSAYNGGDALPLDLPKKKTQTVFRTKTHKGKGFNELRFDDENGQQEIFIHAQKNMDVQVRNSKNERVDYDSQSSIGHDEMRVIANNRTLTVEGQQDHKTAGNYRELIEGDNHLTIQGDLVQNVTGAVSLLTDSALTLQSSDKITFRVGSSFIAIHSGGVDIQGPAINAGPNFTVTASGTPGEVILPTAPLILDAAAAAGSPFVSHCPEKKEAN